MIMMKPALTSLLLLCLAPIPARARTFTDTQGRKLEAEVVAVQQGQVRIRRADGKEFTLPVTTFIPADQAYLQQWKPAAKPDPAAAKDAKAEERKANRALEDSVFPKWRDGIAFGWKAKPTLKLASNDAELGKHVETDADHALTRAAIYQATDRYDKDHRPHARADLIT